MQVRALSKNCLLLVKVCLALAHMSACLHVLSDGAAIHAVRTQHTFWYVASDSHHSLSHDDMQSWCQGAYRQALHDGSKAVTHQLPQQLPDNCHDRFIAANAMTHQPPHHRQQAWRPAQGGN